MSHSRGALQLNHRGLHSSQRRRHLDAGKKKWASVPDAREALDLRLRASRERRVAKDVWTSAAHFATPHAWPMRLRSRYEFEFSAVQISGLPGNDRPLTHTVTLHPAR